jgi:hypothetical protein
MAVARPVSRLDFFVGLFDSCGLDRESARFVERCLALLLAGFDRQASCVCFLVGLAARAESL